MNWFRLSCVSCAAATFAVMAPVASVQTEAPVAATAPSTQPARDGGAIVLVLPFEPIDASARDDRLARGLLQCLLTELSRTRSLQTDALSAACPESDAHYDTHAALRYGRQRGARWVLCGTYEVVGSDVRLLGQVVDVRTGWRVDGLKATAPARDLLDLEYRFVAQAQRSLLALAIPAPPVPPQEVPVRKAVTARGAEPSEDYLGLRIPPRPAKEDAASLAWDRYRLQGYDWCGWYSGYGGGAYGWPASYCAYANYTHVGYGPVYSYGWPWYGGARPHLRYRD